MSSCTRRAPRAPGGGAHAAGAVSAQEEKRRVSTRNLAWLGGGGAGDLRGARGCHERGRAAPRRRARRGARQSERSGGVPHLRERRKRHVRMPVMTQPPLPKHIERSLLVFIRRRELLPRFSLMQVDPRNSRADEEGGGVDQGELCRSTHQRFRPAVRSVVRRSVREFPFVLRSFSAPAGRRGSCRRWCCCPRSGRRTASWQARRTWRRRHAPSLRHVGRPSASSPHPRPRPASPYTHSIRHALQARTQRRSARR